MVTAAVLAAEMMIAAGSAQSEADEVVGRVAEKVAAAQRAAAPVLTGATRDSISAVRVAPGVWIAGPETDYARHIEYGTAHVPPRPFVAPAGDQHADELVEGVVEVGDF